MVIHTVFQDEKSRKNYDKDSKHLAFSDLLMPAVEDGMNSVLSFDMTLPDGASDFLRKYIFQLRGHCRVLFVVFTTECLLDDRVGR